MNLAGGKYAGGRAVPLTPGSGGIRQALMSNVAQCLEGPGMSLRIERGIIAIVNELRDGCHALLVRQHSGFSQAACGALPHGR